MRNEQHWKLIKRGKLREHTENSLLPTLPSWVLKFDLLLKYGFIMWHFNSILKEKYD